MIRANAKYAIVCSLILGAGHFCANCFAKPQAQQAEEMASSPVRLSKDEQAGQKPLSVQTDEDEIDDAAIGNSNPLGLPFFKHLLSDQKSIWESPRHLRWADGTWLFPLAAVTAGFLSTDKSVPPALSMDPNKLNRYTSISNFGLYSMIGAGGGMYLWSKFSHDDHQKETAVLAGESAIDSLAVVSAFKYSLGRARPYQDQGQGNFFDNGTSFPSDHSAVAWSIASVIAHEYPGPLTQIAAYGLAAGVSATRVLGKQHFPSDVLVGGAIGWLIGRQIYRAHHDPELGGGGWNSLSGSEDDEERRDRRTMGSTFAPLDSWVYAAFERLAALGYIRTGMMGLKPWTRIECARLTEEAGEALQLGQTLNDEAAQIQSRLALEFGYEINLLSGGRNISAHLESVYARGVSISGPPLIDSYHFGQTIAYDFGRPFERGTNGQVGGSFSVTAGPLAMYVRAEYQHAPSAPALPPSVVNFISQSDGGTAIGDEPIPVSEIPSGPVAATNRIQVLDAYVSVNLDNWQIVLGRQSLSWAPGSDSMLWSNNIEPVNMVQLVNPESFFLHGLLRYLGPIRSDEFFGRLGGHPYVPRPFVYGQKFNIKPFKFLELGFARRGILGGSGSNSPLTAGNFIHNFLGQSTGGIPGLASSSSIPGDVDTEMDWTFYVPKTRNYFVLYGDAYAEDDGLPVLNPARNPWHPGIYITRFPGLPKLDFHMEGVSTEQSGLIPQVGGGNHGIFNYWNQSYRDGKTNYGNLIGNTVGRDGRAIQSWFTYWISSKDKLQISYKHSSVSADFVPGGGAWQDYGVQYETYLRKGFYMKSQLQYEHISRYPILFAGSKENITAILEVGLSSGTREK